MEPQREQQKSGPQELPRQKPSEKIQTQSTSVLLEAIEPKQGTRGPGGPKVRSGVRSSLKEAGVEGLRLIPRLS